MTMRAGVYGRNSKGEAKSVEDQLSLGLTAVEREGWTLAGKFQDKTSASGYRKKEREEWPKLLAAIAAGELDVLVLWKPARGSRELVDWAGMLALCVRHGVVIHVLADKRTYDPSIARDWKTLAEDGVSATHYSAALSEDVRRGVRESAVAGGVHGRLAFGYERHYDERTGRFARQVEGAHAPIVREIFARLDAKTPISELTRDLNARAVVSPSGQQWRRNTVRTIATNVAYVGTRSHKGQTYPAQWPALVEEDVFWRVQEMLGDPERKTTKPGAAKYLLSYVGFAPCGGRLRNVVGRPGRVDRYGCECGCVSIARPDTDAVVEYVLIERMSRPDARRVFAVDSSAVRAARAEASRLRGQLEEARRSFEGVDGISAVALARKERTLQPLIDDAERRGRVGGRSAELERMLEADDFDQVRAVWDGMTIAARRDAVGQIMSVVVGRPSRRLSRYADQDERETEVLQRLAGSRWHGDPLTWGEHRRAENAQ